jgi:pimeloyl-ACP methyl ester carboxylesterase
VAEARAAGVPAIAPAATEAWGPSVAGPAPRPDGSWALQERALSHLAAFIESGAELNAYDSRAWLPQLQVPFAAVVTLRDRVVSRWRQEAMVELLPGCRRYTVDGGHDAVVADTKLFLPTLARACSDLALAR